jgi:ribonuclease HI
MNNTFITYSDGGARGNPGPAGIGAVILSSDKQEVLRISEYVGETTNNQAEYKALIRVLEEAGKLGSVKLLCHLDSELVVRQLQGRYKIREESLKPLAEQALRLTRQFESVEFVHVKREKNKLADKLVNQALDIHQKN